MAPVLAKSQASPSRMVHLDRAICMKMPRQTKSSTTQIETRKKVRVRLGFDMHALYLKPFVAGLLAIPWSNFGDSGSLFLTTGADVSSDHFG